jgi:hypothetical protein
VHPVPLWPGYELEPEVDERPPGPHAQWLLRAAAARDVRAHAGGRPAEVGHVLSCKFFEH